MTKWIALIALGFSGLAQAADPVPANPEQAGNDYVAGQRYYAGDGVPQDYKRAAQLFRNAADQGHAYAQYSLGLMYDHGYGVAQDSRQAIRWYEQAAQQGHTAAKRRLSALDITVKTRADSIQTEPEAAAPVPLPPMPAELVFVEQKKPAPAAAPPTPVPRAEAPQQQIAVAAPVASPPAVVETPSAPAAPPPATEIYAATPAPAAEGAQAVARTDAALAAYQSAMESKNYAAALRSLQEARVNGQVPQLGLNELQSAEVLARLAIMANDDMLALVYLRQASSLGSGAAQIALDRLANGADLAALATDFKAAR